MATVAYKSDPWNPTPYHASKSTPTHPGQPTPLTTND